MDTATIIGYIESGNDKRAIRFEPEVYDKQVLEPWFDAIVKVNKCSHDTARAINAISWGIYQFMGATLYGQLGWRGTIIDFVASEQEQSNMFAKLTRLRGIIFTVDELRAEVTKRSIFALHYNGPNNVDAYAARIAAEIARRDQLARP